MKALYSFAIALAICSAVPAQNAPWQQIQPWKSNPANGHWYTVTKGAMPWHTAEALAISLGGHLVTIRSAQEQSWIISNFPTATQAWIGLTDQRVEKQWEWISGEPAKYRFWCRGQPGGGTAQNWAYLWANCTNGKHRWNDLTSSSARAVIEVKPGSYGTFGNGCSGSTKSTATMASFGQPRIGRQIYLNFMGLPSNSPGFVVVGASDRKWNVLALPYSLTTVGAPGCFIYASVDFALPTRTGPNGMNVFKLDLPANAALVGGEFFNQGAFLTPKANRLGMLFTNGGRARIGG